MDRWLGGQVARWTGGQEDSWSGGKMDKWTGGQVARWTDGKVVRWTSGQVDMWSGGQVFRWPGGQVVRWTGGHLGNSTVEMKCSGTGLEIVAIVATVVRMRSNSCTRETPPLGSISWLLTLQPQSSLLWRDSQAWPHTTERVRRSSYWRQGFTMRGLWLLSSARLGGHCAPSLQSTVGLQPRGRRMAARGRWGRQGRRIPSPHWFKFCHKKTIWVWRQGRARAEPGWSSCPHWSQIQSSEHQNWIGDKFSPSRGNCGVFSHFSVCTDSLFQSCFVPPKL